MISIDDLLLASLLLNFEIYHTFFSIFFIDFENQIVYFEQGCLIGQVKVNKILKGFLSSNFERHRYMKN